MWLLCRSRIEDDVFSFRKNRLRPPARVHPAGEEVATNEARARGLPERGEAHVRGEGV